MPYQDVAQIGAALGQAYSNESAEWRSFQSRISWSEAVRLGSGSLGEIRTMADVAKLPRGKTVRAVLVDDGGPCIRWGTDAMAQVLPVRWRGRIVACHDAFHCLGDARMPTREGYLIVNSSGHLSVK